jgi:ferredoxin
MPTLTVEGFPSVEVPSGKRLVLAIEQDAGVDVLHACGGNARCTTCRVEFVTRRAGSHDDKPKRRGWRKKD